MFRTKLFFLVLLSSLLLTPYISLCQTKTYTDKLIDVFTELDSLLIKLKSDNDIYARVNSNKLLCAIEMINKSAKKLAIDQEDFINSISCTNPDLYRINNHINALRGSMFNMHDDIQILQEMLLSEKENYIIKDLDKLYLSLMDKQIDIDTMAQTLLSDEKVSFEINKSKIVDKETLLLNKISSVQHSASELYKQLAEFSSNMQK